MPKDSHVRHTVESLIAATGKSKSTITEALKKGRFGPVEILKIDKKVYYRMPSDAIDFYLKKGYEKQVIAPDNKNTFVTYKYTTKEAIENANKRADEFMVNPERVRLDMLNKLIVSINRCPRRGSAGRP